MPITTQGQEFALSAGPGYSLQSALINPAADSIYVIPNGAPADANVLTPPANTQASTAIPGASYQWYIVAIIAFLVILKYASEHEKADMDPKLVGIGVWNFISVGIMSLLFIVIAKVSFAKYPVPGISQIVGAA